MPTVYYLRARVSWNAGSYLYPLNPGANVLVCALKILPGPSRTGYCAILGGSHAGVALERVGKVALIVETRISGYYAQRRLGLGYFTTRCFDAKLPQVFPNRTVITQAKLACEINRMHADSSSQSFK